MKLQKEMTRLAKMQRMPQEKRQSKQNKISKRKIVTRQMKQTKNQLYQRTHGQSPYKHMHQKSHKVSHLGKLLVTKRKRPPKPHEQTTLGVNKCKIKPSQESRNPLFTFPTETKNFNNPQESQNQELLNNKVSYYYYY